MKKKKSEEKKRTKNKAKDKKTPLNHHSIKFQFHQSNGIYQDATMACNISRAFGKRYFIPDLA